MKYLKLSEICNPKQWKTLSTEQLLDKGFPVYGANGKIGYYSTYNHELPTIMITCRGATCGSINISEPKSWINGNAMCLDNLSSDVSLKYLAFYLQNYNFNHVISGSAQPQITREGLEKVKVKVYAKELQEKISIQLDKAQKIISESKAILEKYDTLIKSRFIEMFGTENDFSKWNCCFVEDVADVTVGVVIKPTHYYCEKGIPAFRSLNIGEMKVNDSDWVYFTEEGNEKNRKSILKENDVLVVRSGAPGKSCVITKKYEGYNVVDAIIAHPNLEKVNPVFLCMFTNMPHGMNQIKAKTGGAAQQHFNVGGYNSLKIILPPLSLQNDFAAFVQQIDKSKFAVQKSLEKTETLYKSLMQRYFA